MPHRSSGPVPQVLKRRGNNFGGQDNTARYQFERVQCQATGIECDRRIYSKKLLTRRSGKGLLRELGLHFRLQHPRIVPVYMSFDDSENVFVLLQAVDGDLDVLLEDAGRSQEIQVQYGIARPLIEALSYLHNDHGIIHRGLQPSAIYFVGEKVMLGDFSLALCQRESLPMSVVGPPMYMVRSTHIAGRSCALFFLAANPFISSSESLFAGLFHPESFHSIRYTQRIMRAICMPSNASIQSHPFVSSSISLPLYPP